jgi:hypothetical protein
VSGDKRSEWTTKPCERDTLTILKRGTSQADPNFLSLSAVLFPAEEEPKAFYRLLAGPDFAEKQPFKTGQDASFLLSRIEFDRTGDELPFNHPKTIASDGHRLRVGEYTFSGRIVLFEAPWSTQLDPP